MVTAGDAYQKSSSALSGNSSADMSIAHRNDASIYDVFSVKNGMSHEDNVTRYYMTIKKARVLPRSNNTFDSK